ncbi:TonB-dependent receptor [Rhizorhabdus histidinilytica]|uniref:Iron complex outermembrane recepter protein n=1 Tax=Rhizorhabdus histidinilytica TaxID=439228 RepID=A0A1T5BR32_9SPHN|nr:TonB-dependent receptor [Rhizorhabdus histidinilytica]SKB49615.1 iron complex outermembrane recepter protein [Rhizorhabdus histidinilytica]
MKKLMLGCAISALAASGAYAQSTGSIDFENDIVVTGSSINRGVAGVIAPDTSKSKAVLTQEFITHQTPGQTINDVINQLPGVSFQNNDPFGSAGGTLTIRGFDDQRISQTFDGVPLNDSGGYALYSNQQLDPELIEQVNVNLGTTDVDSPTAAATGSTVNYRTRNPTQDFGVNLMGSAGRFDFMRIFGSVDTGVFTPWGTRAFVAASRATNDAIFGKYGKIDKSQYNAKIYQPIGDNGDFISIAGHYNQNRNNFFGSSPLRVDTTGGRTVGTDSSNRFPLTKDERFFAVPRCTVAPGVTGVADAASSCGSLFDYRLNPSNTGNIRINSKFTLSDKLTLTVDPSYQYVKANGGGTFVASEKLNAQGYSGFVQASSSSQPSYFFGKDLNGDGDALDNVRIQAPSQTRTDRYGLISSLRYDLNDDHTVRVNYSLDYARHRQTGEAGLLDDAGKETAFPANNPLVGVNGNVLNKRDRLSYAILNQFSAEYRGEFLDDSLVINAGIRAPFFKRKLTNYCFALTATGNVACFSGNDAGEAAYAAANPTIQGPQKRTFKYDKILPNIGFVYDLTSKISAFGSYSKGIQVPGTDNLYNSFFYARNTPSANPVPETTDNFDLGARYRSGKVQAQGSFWYTLYKDRLASAYDRDLNVTIYRNLGKVTKYGYDGSISYTPIPELSIYAFGSYLKSKIKDNVELSATTVALTKGKRESGAPIYTAGGRIQGNLGPVQLGVQAKRTGSRYVNDQNLPVFANGVQVYGAKVRGYTLVDLDARISLEWAGLNDKTYFQINVTNLFDKLYVGGFDGTLSNTGTTFANIGAPRTVIGTLSIGF